MLVVASTLGGIGLLETFGLLYLARSVYYMPLGELQSLIFLKLVVAGHLTLLVARTKDWMWSRPRPAPLLALAVLSTQTLAALIVGFGWFVTPLPWSVIGLVWLYCLLWVGLEDVAKKAIYALLDRGRPLTAPAAEPLRSHHQTA